MIKEEVFRNKVFEVEAIQWIGVNHDAIRTFTGVHKIENYGEHFIFVDQEEYDTAQLFLEATDSWIPIKVSDWVLKGPDGFYLMTDENFYAKYEQVNI